ncbi:MAG TPA: hypothetical protein VFJ74_00215 [Gemmatimonadaceae bacterium]|nr:hypothetical protein [Gemmatimonadaceae bacterium]
MRAFQKRAQPLVATAAIAIASAAHDAGAQMLPDTGAAAARTAQRRFESYRKARLPIELRSSADCETRIGRLCYWNSNEDGPAPEEPREIGRERAALVAKLAAVDSASPDTWVSGQLVRYLVESHRPEDAVAAARRCGRGGADTTTAGDVASPSSSWWCAAVRGYALHAAGDDAAAASAFDSALAAMPDTLRCRWTDVSFWLDGDAAHHFASLGCGAAREREARRVWWLSRPLLAAREGDDALAEFLARRTLATMFASSATPPYATSWGSDVEEVGIRYGWPTAWSREPAPIYQPLNENIIGHEPRPAHAFVPAPRALDDPTRAADGDWTLEARDTRSRYAPAYADSFFVLPHQLARFRRGDSSLVVAAYDVAGDDAWAHGPLRAAFALETGPDSTLALEVRDDAPPRGALLLRAPARSALAGVELYSATARRAARSRYGVAPLAPDAAVSDLLLVRADGYADAAIADLADATARALGRPAITEGESVGLFWETYVTPTVEAPLAVSLTIVPTSLSLAQRLAIALRLAERPTPMTLKWDDTGRPEGPAGHVMVLHTDGVPSGHYRLELSVSGGGLERAAVTSREIEISGKR